MRCSNPLSTDCVGIQCSSCQFSVEDAAHEDVHDLVKASNVQVGGGHYKDFPIQPAEYCQKNKLDWCEANIVKYASRHASKNGAEDVRKIIHYAELLLEWNYGETK